MLVLLRSSLFGVMWTGRVAPRTRGTGAISRTVGCTRHEIRGLPGVCGATTISHIMITDIHRKLIPKTVSFEKIKEKCYRYY